MPLPCSFALVNVLAITTRLIVSAMSCVSEQACNCVTDLPKVLRYVLRRLRAKKLLSNVQTHVFKKIEVGHAYSKIECRKPN